MAKGRQGMSAAKKKEVEDPEMTFEQAMARLQEIVEEMEGAELPLEAILKRYEEGTRLRLFCERKLRDAEERVKKIRPGPDGEPIEEEMDAAGMEPAADADLSGGRDDNELLL